ncbi:type IV pili methyl-accepting chemotaxis transducer N-terminal domain-containing protein [Pseudomonas stutzeri]|nr:type IV pili methyl-accepting chemotaxis transducer N-terminal domain-containing protein [Stutzerimonas stutzeri]
MIRRLAVLPLLLLVLLSPPSRAAIDHAEAVNLSGMQRMLSQRIAKSYLMIGTEVRADEANVQLDQSMATFERNHLALVEYAPSADIRNGLAKTGELWQRYRALALTRPDKPRAVELLALSDQLLAQCEQVVQLIERHAGSRSAWLVNRSGRQRMLSQRIAKLYLARSWHLPVSGLEEQFEQAVREFGQALGELQQAKQNTQEISAALSKADAQWQYSRVGFRLSADGRYVPTVIAVTTESLLEQMQALTVAYTAHMQNDS